MVATEKEWLRFDEFRRRNPDVGPKTLRDLARRREIPAVIAGRRLLIRADALDVLAESQRQSTGASK